MDPLTHGLASFAVTRAFSPQASRATVVAAVVTGTVADLDWLSTLFGPAAYFAAHHVYTHSILATVLIASLASGLSSSFSRQEKNARSTLPMALGATTLAGLLHLAMDASQSDGIALLWPSRGGRMALDCVPGLDPWILTILLAGALVPALLRLVTEEIGARAKGPRRRGGAVLAMLALVAYTGGRGFLHAEAVAALQARTYRGEIARKAAAFPDSVSPFQWRGIAETESALYRVPVPVGPGASFDPEAAVATFKPEASALLDAARDSSAARRFLEVARFPKATVEKTSDGYRFELRDLRYAATGETDHALAVLVELGLDAKIQSHEIVWERDLPR